MKSRGEDGGETPRLGTLLERGVVVEDLTDCLEGFDGLRVSMLREDLRHPIAGGNKLWKLRLALGEARRLGRRRLVTQGGAHSNHLLATAWAGAACGFETLGLVRGEIDESNPLLRVCARLGMRLEGVARGNYRAGVFGELADGDYFIPEGGTSELGAEGVAGFIESLPEKFDHVVVAVGTGGTLAGMARGLGRSSPGTLAHGILVVKGAGDDLRGRLATLAPGCFNWRLWGEFCEGRYGTWTPRIEGVLDNCLRRTGIALDPVYTGKMVAGAARLAERGEFKQGDRVLLFHTGGFAAAWGHFGGGVAI